MSQIAGQTSRWEPRDPRFLSPNVKGDGQTDDYVPFTQTLAKAAGGALLLPPKAQIKLDISDTARQLIELPANTTIEFGLGAKLLIYVNAGMPVTRTLFKWLNENIWLIRPNIELLSADDGSTIIGFQLAGGKNGIMSMPEIDGNVTLSGGVQKWIFDVFAAPGIGAPDAAKDFDGMLVEAPYFHDMSRMFLKSNTDHSVQKNFTIRDPRFADFYRPILAINSPQALSQGWLIEGGSSRNQLAKTTSETSESFHYGLGSGKDVRFKNHEIVGAGDAIHIEEQAENISISGVQARLTDADAFFVRLTDNNIGDGVTWISPKNVVIDECEAIAPGKATSSATRGFGVWVINNGGAAGVDRLDIDKLYVQGFNRGVSLDPKVTHLTVRRVHGSDCKFVIYSPSKAVKYVDNCDGDSSCTYGAYAITAGGEWGAFNDFSECVTEIADGADPAAPTNTRFTPFIVGRTDKVSWFDDFCGDSLDALWGTLIGTDGACVAATKVAGISGGAVRLTAGAGAAATVAANGSQLHSYLEWRAIDGGLFMRTRFRVSLGTSLGFFVGFTNQIAALQFPIQPIAGGAFTYNAADAFGVTYDTGSDDPDTVRLVGNKNGVAATSFNTGIVPVANQFDTWQLDCDINGNVVLKRNGQAVGSITAAVTTNALLTPVFFIYSRAAATKLLEIDYVAVLKTRI